MFSRSKRHSFFASPNGRGAAVVGTKAVVSSFRRSPGRRCLTEKSVLSSGQSKCEVREWSNLAPHSLLPLPRKEPEARPTKQKVEERRKRGRRQKKKRCSIRRRERVLGPSPSRITIEADVLQATGRVRWSCERRGAQGAVRDGSLAASTADESSFLSLLSFFRSQDCGGGGKSNGSGT